MGIIDLDTRVTKLEKNSGGGGGGGSQFTPEEVNLIKSNLNYSFDEVEIGTWTNGKPVYRKVFPFNGHTYISSDTWAGTGIDTTGMQRILKIDALFQYNSHIAVSGQIAYNSLQLRSATGNNVLLEYVILEYVKN